ncbi:hypothetical protein H0H92_008151, partial [Tricholoma furcatifolium]
MVRKTVGWAAECSHPDVDIWSLEPLSVENYQKYVDIIISSEDQASYEQNRKAMGLSKPSLFSGLNPELTMGIPR